MRSIGLVFSEHYLSQPRLLCLGAVRDIEARQAIVIMSWFYHSVNWYATNPRSFLQRSSACSSTYFLIFKFVMFQAQGEWLFPFYLVVCTPVSLRAFQFNANYLTRVPKCLALDTRHNYQFSRISLRSPNSAENSRRLQRLLVSPGVC